MFVFVTRTAKRSGSRNEQRSKIWKPAWRQVADGTREVGRIVTIMRITTYINFSNPGLNDGDPGNLAVNYMAWGNHGRAADDSTRGTPAGALHL
jgi:hypothetical protein